MDQSWKPGCFNRACEIISHSRHSRLNSSLPVTQQLSFGDGILKGHLTFSLKVEQNWAVRNRKRSECGCRAGAPTLQLRSVAPRRQRPRDPARPTRITQPEPRSVLCPGPWGRGCQTWSSRDKDPPRPWPGAAGQRWSGVFADAPRQRPRWGGGRGTAEERRPPARGAPAETRAGWTETPPTAASLSPPPHYLALWASRLCRRRRLASELGRRKESRLAGVSCVLRSRSSLQVGMKKGLSWESATRLAPGLWGFYSSCPSHSASAPPPCPALPLLGDLRPVARRIVGDVVQECGRRGTCLKTAGTYSGSGDAVAWQPEGAASSFLRIGRRASRRLTLWFNSLQALKRERGRLTHTLQLGTNNYTPLAWGRGLSSD